jgi:hypothetical protein
MWRYQGRDPMIGDICVCSGGDVNAGFCGLPGEWWHFTVENWNQVLPPSQAQRAVNLCHRQTGP